MIRILLVDDDIFLRVKLRNLLATSEPDFSVVAEASNGEEAVACMERERPHLMINRYQHACDEQRGIDRLYRRTLSRNDGSRIELLRRFFVCTRKHEKRRL